ncbi:MAG: dihydrodipicolinate synthase family protein [Verrucomicrobia bacterium]|nr:dihydrodipicolinate synthase family protein [Verrucomicrobiota bacterium]
MNPPLPTTRADWHARLLPRGIQPLWCPLLTHYRDDGSLDHARITAHLRHLAPHVKGFLIPGSTGDGWEMSDGEIRELLGLAKEQTAKLELHLLIGVLKTEARDACSVMREYGREFSAVITEHGTRNTPAFTVCPPKGADLPQQTIRDAMAGILELGFPTALYQLPQVTQNEMSPETLAELAARFPNFILFKDTSGADRVANSGQDFGGVFLVRGAEGDYARWLKSGGGPYDGFLLSTANCFGRELHQVIELLKSGRRDEAQHLSVRLSAVVKEVFALVAGLPDGNAFANANKAMDHFFAHGPTAANVTPPRLHAGSRLPAEVIRQAGAALERHGFLPQRGYLD